MKTRLEDGRIFETIPFEIITRDPTEPVYEFIFVTKDRRVQSSPRHRWMVWNKKSADIEMVRMDEIKIGTHELFVQSE